MPPAPTLSANRLLGYPPDARLLILNADDFGMCQAVNRAITGVLAAGVVRSTTLMMPCPSAPEALRFLAAAPGQPFGVHLTAICDGPENRLAPLSPREQVPSLVDADGYFYTFAHMAPYLAQVRLAELEVEFRAQIEAVLAAGLKPSHLDWHSLRISGRQEFFDLLSGLAREYGLALRVMGRGPIEKLLGQGLPVIESDFLDSYLIDPAAKPAEYARRLHELPAGLSEWAIHPGLDTPELLALEPTGRGERQADFDFWTSPAARALVAAEGITLLDYRALQPLWAPG